MSKYAIEFNGFGIRWYSIMLLTAVVIGIFIFLREGRRFNFDREFLFNLFFWTVVMGFIGARAYYVIFNFDEYKDNLVSVFKIWEGGLAIHGGIIAGFLTLVIYCKKYNARVFKITDMATFPLILGQAIGRWGNFFNKEAHGAATTYAKLKDMKLPEWIIDNMNINGKYYEPTFLYESAWCILGFIVLLIARKFKYLKVGQLTSIYLMWYSLGRFFIEAKRTDSLMLGGFKVAQLVSVVLFVVGMVAFMILSKQSKFENLYNEEDVDKITF